MKIYAIRRDGYKYQELDLNINDFIDALPESISYQEAHEFSKNNLSFAEFWPSMKTGFSEIEGHENLIPDIAPWIGATLLLSPRAFTLLNDVLKSHGEFLPIVIEDETYQIFNCLTLVDAIEEESDETNIVFEPSSMENKLVFKSGFQHCMDVFCVGSIKEFVESSGLKGVKFDPRLGVFEE